MPSIGRTWWSLHQIRKQKIPMKLFLQKEFAFTVSQHPPAHTTCSDVLLISIRPPYWKIHTEGNVNYIPVRHPAQPTAPETDTLPQFSVQICPLSNHRRLYLRGHWRQTLKVVRLKSSQSHIWIKALWQRGVGCLCSSLELFPHAKPTYNCFSQLLMRIGERPEDYNSREVL